MSVLGSAADIEVVQIGGPALPAGPTRVQRVDLRLPAVKELAGRLHEADRVIYWPEQSFFTAVPALEDTEGMGAVPGFHFGGQRAAAGSPGVPIDRAGGEAELAKWAADSSLLAMRMTGALAELLQNVFAVANAGGLVILVIPEDFSRWSVHVQKAAYGWAFPRLDIWAEKDNRVDVSPRMMDNPTIGAMLVGRAERGGWTELWPFSMGFDYSTLGVLPDHDRDTHTAGADNAAALTPLPELPGRIEFFAAVTNRFGRAKALACIYGRGGFLILPPPQNPGMLLAGLTTAGATAEKPPTEVAATAPGPASTLDILLLPGPVRGSRPTWQVAFNGKCVSIGERTFLLLMSFVVAAKNDQEGIDPTAPRIGRQRLDTIGVFTARSVAGDVDTTAKPAQQIHEAFREQGCPGATLIETIPHTGDATRRSLYRLVLPARNIKIASTKGKTLPEPLRRLLGLLE